MQKTIQERVENLNLTCQAQNIGQRIAGISGAYTQCGSGQGCPGRCSCICGGFTQSC